MGGNQSKDVESIEIDRGMSLSQEAENRLDEPWTDLGFGQWDENSWKQLFDFVTGYWPLKKLGMDEDDVECVNILLLGPTRAGKTSFFNTINSVFRGHISLQGLVGEDDKSLTVKFKKYPVFTTKSNKRIRFRLCDCRGLEDANTVNEKDIEAIVDGKIKDGYTLNPENHIKEGDEYYEKNPLTSDKIHVVVFVIDSNNPSSMLMTHKVQEQIWRIKSEMNIKGIPQIVLMNKVDRLKADIREDVSCLFKYQSIKKRLDEIANSMKCPPLAVFPMCNYTEGSQTNTNQDILALFNIKRMLQIADDYLANCKMAIEQERPFSKADLKRIEISKEAFERKRHRIEMYNPLRTPFINILLLGPSRSGKATFVNFVNTTINCDDTQFDATAGYSSEKQFLKYRIIKRSDESYLGIRFSTCGGFDDLETLTPGILQQIIDGKVKHGAKIDGADISDTGRLNDPKITDKIHCIIYVIPATLNKDGVKGQFSHLLENVRQSGIPQVAILTKVEEFQYSIKESPRKFYFNVKAKDFVEMISEAIRVRTVFPLVPDVSQEIGSVHGVLCLNILEGVTTVVDDYLASLQEAE